MSDLIKIPTSTELVSDADALDFNRALAEAADSPNTQRAYKQAWRIFTSWATCRGVNACPAQPLTVAAFLQDQSNQGRAVATIRLRASAIAREHKLSGHPDPCEHQLVHNAMRRIAKERGTTQSHAAPLRQRDEDVIVAHAARDHSLMGARNLALLLVGRDLMARAEELCSVTVEMIRPQENGAALVDLLRSKTDTETRPCILCAQTVAAVRRWIEGAGITSGFVFQGLGKAGRRITGHPLCRQDVSRILKRLAAGAGVATIFSSHSLRIGMAQDLLHANHDIGAIAHSGGWKSTAMPLRYVKDLIATDSAVAQYRGKLGK